MASFSNCLTLLNLALIVCLSSAPQPITAKPMAPTESIKLALANQDYLDLQAILGKSLPGTSEEKSKVIDLLLQLLAEIDLPTLCKVISNDTSFGAPDYDVMRQGMAVTPPSFRTSGPAESMSTADDTVARHQETDGPQVTRNADAAETKPSQVNLNEADDSEENTNSTSIQENVASEVQGLNRMSGRPFKIAVRSRNGRLGNVNTDGALPFPLRWRRRKRPFLSARLMKNSKDLKAFGLPEKYRVTRRRKLAKLGQNDNANYFIRSIGIRRPKSQLYSQSLVLGNWMNEHAPGAAKGENGQTSKPWRTTDFHEQAKENEIYTEDGDKSIVKDTKLGRRVMLVVRKGRKGGIPGRRVIFRKRKINAAAAANRGPVQYSVVKQVRAPLSKVPGKAGKKLVKKRFFLPKESLKQRLYRAKGDRFGAGGHRIVRNGGSKRRIFSGRRRVLRRRPGARRIIFPNKDRVLMKAVGGGLEEYRHKGLQAANDFDDEYQENEYGENSEFLATSKERIMTTPATYSSEETTTTMLPANDMIVTSSENIDGDKMLDAISEKTQSTLETEEIETTDATSMNPENTHDEEFLEVDEPKDASTEPNWVDHATYENDLEDQDNMVDSYNEIESYYTESGENDDYLFTNAFEEDTTTPMTRDEVDDEETQFPNGFDNFMTEENENVDVVETTTHGSLFTQEESTHKTQPTSTTEANIKDSIGVTAANVDERKTTTLDSETTSQPPIEPFKEVASTKGNTPTTTADTTVTVSRPTTSSTVYLDSTFALDSENPTINDKTYTDTDYEVDGEQNSFETSDDYQDNAILTESEAPLHDVATTESVQADETTTNMDALLEQLDKSDEEINESNAENINTASEDTSLEATSESNFNITKIASTGSETENSDNSSPYTSNEIETESEYEGNRKETTTTMNDTTTSASHKSEMSAVNNLPASETEIVMDPFMASVDPKSEDEKESQAGPDKESLVPDSGMLTTTPDNRPEITTSGMMGDQHVGQSSPELVDDNSKDKATQNPTVLATETLPTSGQEKSNDSSLPIEKDAHSTKPTYHETQSGVIDSLNNVEDEMSTERESSFAETTNQESVDQSTATDNPVGASIALDLGVSTSRPGGASTGIDEITTMGASVGIPSGIDDGTVANYDIDTSTGLLGGSSTGNPTDPTSQQNDRSSSSVTVSEIPETHTKDSNKTNTRVLIKPTHIDYTNDKQDDGESVNSPASFMRHPHVMEPSDSDEMTSTPTLMTTSLTSSKDGTTTPAATSTMTNAKENFESSTKSMNEMGNLETNPEAIQIENKVAVNAEDNLTNIDVISTAIRRTGLSNVDEEYASLTRDQSQSNLTVEALMNITTILNASKINQSESVLRMLLDRSRRLNNSESNDIDALLEPTRTMAEATTDYIATSSDLKEASMTHEPTTTLKEITSARNINVEKTSSSFAPIQVEETVPTTVATSVGTEVPRSTSEQNEVDTVYLEEIKEDLKDGEIMTGTPEKSTTTDAYVTESTLGDIVATETLPEEVEREAETTTPSVSELTSPASIVNQQHLAWIPTENVKKFGDRHGLLSGMGYWQKPRSGPFHAKFSDWIGPDGRQDFVDPKSHKIDLWKAYNIALTDGEKPNGRSKMQPQIFSSSADRNYLWDARTGKNPFVKGNPNQQSNNVYESQNRGSIKEHGSHRSKGDSFKPASNPDEIRQAHVQDWGQRFSQGFYGRVYNDRRPSQTMVNPDTLNYRRFAFRNGHALNHFEKDFKGKHIDGDNVPMGSGSQTDHIKSPQIIVAQPKSSKDFSDEEMMGLWYENKASSPHTGKPSHFDYQAPKETPLKSDLTSAAGQDGHESGREGQEPDAFSNQVTNTAYFDSNTDLGPVGVAAPDDFVCPGLFGYYSDPEDCAAFFICSWSTPYRLRCPSGTRWNPSISACDWAINVPCNNQVYR